MEDRVVLTPTFKMVTFGLMAVGIIVLIVGLITQPERTWANYLLNSYYFLAIAIGASFFYAIQYITQSGWATGFKRVSEAMFAFLPWAAIFFLFIYFGMHALYSWTHPDIVAQDPLIQNKIPYLNIPFFYIRLVVYFVLWIVITRYLRKLSIQEDISGGMDYFNSSEFYSKIFIFILAITFSTSLSVKVLASSRISNARA